MWKRYILMQRKHRPSGIVGLLLFPFILLIGVVAFVLAAPVLIVMFFWMRHKLKRFFSALGGREDEVQESFCVDSYVVETPEYTDEPGRLLSDGGEVKKPFTDER